MYALIDPVLTRDMSQVIAWALLVGLAVFLTRYLWPPHRPKDPTVRPPEPLGLQIRPQGHQFKWDWPGKPDREFESVVVRVHHDGPLRVVAGVDLVDPVFVYTCAHRTTPLIINIQSLLYASAEDPISIWIFSPQEFKVDYVDARVRLSPARIQRFREESMQKTGMVSSLPHPGSHAGREFYRENPDLIP